MVAINPIMSFVENIHSIDIELLFKNGTVLADW
jgi:hypothetical protein